MIDASARAERAQQLLDDELLSEVLNKLENFAVTTCLQVETFEPSDAVSAICQLKAVYSIREQLKSVLTTGKAQEQKRPAVA